jgi:hypothetical protein
MILKTRAWTTDLLELEPPGVGYGKTLHVVKQKGKISSLVMFVKYAVRAFPFCFLHTRRIVSSLKALHGTLLGERSFSVLSFDRVIHGDIYVVSYTLCFPRSGLPR